MARLSNWRRALSILAATGGVGLAAAALVSGCGSKPTEPLPAEATTPGVLKPPALPKASQPLAKNINPNAPRSIKELQGKPEP